MSISSWNCRGLGDSRAVLMLTKMVRDEAPLLVFLAETKVDISFMKKVQAKLEYTQGVIVPSDGRSGGLAMMWKEGSHVEVHKYSHSHIDVIIFDHETNLQWRATGFYGHLDSQQRHISRKLLERLNTQLSLPWTVFGDFNKITYLDEKCGGVERSADQMQAF
ncbi:hypothetical protein SO802_034212 [Lithocarpus litseifolius]|uniref:Endonuclease/exonuclease/phosphatase domain-containing protein n=1 Tax=Lithocarpus litseifolius TaxID=425828 RepID=A0AAW2BFZ4_9ROSI